MVNFEKDITFLDFIPSAKENAEVLELSKKLDDLNSITLALQRDNIDIASVRVLFKGVVENYADIDASQKYLRPDSDIVKFKAFECGIVKIQDRQEKKMSMEEMFACRDLRVARNAEITESSEPEKENLDFAAGLLAKRSKVEKPNFIDTRFILPTSNILEQFFSNAGIAYSDLRTRLIPTNLEEQLYLKINKRFWDLQTINAVVNSYFN